MVKTDVPGVFKRGERYIAVTRFKGRQVKTYHRTKTEARAAKARRDAGESPRSRERFAPYAERWLTEYEGRTRRGLADTTRRDYADQIRRFAIPYFRGQAIGDIAAVDVRGYIEHLKGLKPQRPQKGAHSYSAASIRRALAPLKAMLAEAYELGLTRADASRVRTVIRGERHKPAPKALTSAQLVTLTRAIPNAEDRLLVVFLADTGARISEALGAKWRDVKQTEQGPVFNVSRQFYRGELVEQTKTEGSAQPVALLPELASALTFHRLTSAFHADDDPIFPTVTGSHRDAHNWRGRVFNAARKRAGLEWATPHTLRHSLATNLHEQGHTADFIASVLRHTDPAFTKRVYVHSRTVQRFDAFRGLAASLEVVEG